MPFFTVFTPTYNRAYILPKLYRSLKEQTFIDFEWLVVDDGSNDNTEALVQQWINDKSNNIRINYIKKENGGKPRAINLGTSIANGLFFFMVDSDDYLHPKALEKMYKWCKEIENEPKFIGVGAAKAFPNGEYIKGCAPIVNDRGFVDATNLQRAEYNLDADMCEAYKTDIFKKFPMAEWPGEKFAPEQIALNEIALSGYLLRWHSDIIYYCDYLEDGLTKGSFDLEKNNPMGYAMMYNHTLKYPNKTFKQKLFTSCQMIALSIIGKHSSYITKSNNKLILLLTLLPGLMLSVRRYFQLRK